MGSIRKKIPLDSLHVVAGPNSSIILRQQKPYPTMADPDISGRRFQQARGAHTREAAAVFVFFSALLAAGYFGQRYLNIPD